MWVSHGHSSELDTFTGVICSKVLLLRTCIKKTPVMMKFDDVLKNIDTISGLTVDTIGTESMRRLREKLELDFDLL